jgi:hypothetical protein
MANIYHRSWINYIGTYSVDDDTVSVNESLIYAATTAIYQNNSVTAKVTKSEEGKS